MFNTLQRLFCKFIFLSHFDFSWCLYIDVNVFKQYKFNIIIYYINNNLNNTEWSYQKIQFILFFNKFFIFIEQNYWSTEMKTIELVWVVQKTHHLIKLTLFRLIIIVFTNHSATTLIIQQTHFTIMTSTNKLNLHLTQVSQYLNQFNLNIQHCSKKIHLVSDVLLWLLENMKKKR